MREEAEPEPYAAGQQQPETAPARDRVPQKLRVALQRELKGEIRSVQVYKPSPARKGQ